MSHTPGPWVRRDIASKDMYVGPANDGGAPNVAIIPKRITRTDDEQLANARLIAAAPSMLFVLKDLFAYFRDCEDVYDGPDGEQRPNDAMLFLNAHGDDIEAVINAAEGKK